MSKSLLVRIAIAAFTGTLVSAALVAPPASAALGDVTEFSLAPSTGPWDVATGPDANLWVTNQASGTISRVTPAGAVTTFPLPTAGAAPRGITAGPDGNLWFTEYNGNKIGRITPTGVVTEFAVPTAGSAPMDIAAGSDGNLWFTEYLGNKIGRITPGGSITEFALPTPNSGPFGITAGPVGSERLYFTQYLGNRVGTISTVGTVVNAASLGAGSGPTGIAVVGGSVWLVANGGNSLIRMVNDATPSVIALGGGLAPFGLTGGPGNTIWVSMLLANQVWRFDGQGVVQAKTIVPTVSSAVSAITVGPDGNVWVAESGTDKVARVIAVGPPASTAPPVITPAVGVVPGTVLTASTGAWSNSPSAYAFQWLACPSGEASCAPIVGATAQAYTVQAGDNAKALRVTVTATGAGGTSTAANSALVAVGSATPPPPPPPPVATGPTAALAAGVTATLTGPSSQKRKTTKTYKVSISAADAQGAVTFVMTKGSKVRTFASVPVAAGVASVKWKVPSNWSKGSTKVTATFVPVVGSPYASGAMKRTVKIT